jgi:hypothetical protein
MVQTCPVALLNHPQMVIYKKHMLMNQNIVQRLKKYLSI